jgi:lipopolysaccharide export system permease protein
VKLASKYVLKEHAGPLAFALGALTSLVLLDYVAQRLAQFVGKGLPWWVLVQFVGWSLPLVVAMTTPMAVLVATLYAFNRLAAENEITAFKASGVSARRLLAPVLAASVVLAVALVVFNDQMLSRANKRLGTLLDDVARTTPTLALRPRVLNELTPALVLRANVVDNGRSTMRDVTIYDMTPASPRTIRADSGALAFLPGGSDLQLTLHHGTVDQLGDRRPQELQRMFYATQVIRVRDAVKGFEASASTAGREWDGRAMSICELQSAYERARMAYFRAELDDATARARAAGRAAPRSLSRHVYPGIGGWYCGALRGVAQLGVRDAQAQEALVQAQVPNATADTAARLDLQRERAAMNAYDAEIHKKFALAVACVVFVLLGAPVALRVPRGGVGMVIGASLFIFTVYYSCLTAGQELATRGLVAPWIAMWAANLLAAAAGVPLALAMGSEHATTRGGGLGERVAALLDRLSR